MNVPAPVEAAIAEAAGSRTVSSQHVVAGHTHAEKWLVELADGRRAFVKAATDEAARAQIEREASVLEAVGASYMPGVHGAATVEPWSVLVLEDLSAGRWPPPYPDRGEALLETVRQVSATRPPPTLHRRPAGRPHGTYWQRIRTDPKPVVAHGLFSEAWLEEALPVLDAAEASAKLAGEDLLHDDVWAENVCYVDRGAVLIDWASASIGDRRIDLAYALLSIRSSPAVPPVVDFPDEAAYAALLAGANAFQAAQPVDPSIKREEVLRAGWLHDLHFALDWASDLLELPPRKGS